MPPAPLLPGRKPYDLSTTRYDYPEWEGPPRRTVLVITYPRSGSTLLGEALYFAGGLGCPLEYFHDGFRPFMSKAWGAPEIGDYIAAAHRHRTDPGGTFAVKLFWRDLAEMIEELAPGRFPSLLDPAAEPLTAETYREIMALLAPAFPNPTFLHLWRRDRVRRAVSSHTAVQTGRWREIDGHGPDVKGEAHYNFNSIDNLIAWSDFTRGHWTNMFAALAIDPFTLTYEELYQDYEGTVRRLLHHLGSDAEPPAIRMQRQSTANNEQWVLRYLMERAKVLAGDGSAGA
jgi:LPS sulfotransferase NodH